MIFPTLCTAELHPAHGPVAFASKKTSFLAHWFTRTTPFRVQVMTVVRGHVMARPRFVIAANDLRKTV